MSAPTQPKPTRRTGRRLLRVLLWVVVGFLALFYLGGGWYFSNQLIVDGFTPRPFQRTYRAEVVKADSAEVTIRQGSPADGDLFSPGTHGLVWEGGYGQVGAIVSQTEIEVVRVFTPEEGGVPAAGTPVDVDPWIYPDDPREAGVELEEITYTTPLGEMDAWFLPASSDTWLIIVHGLNADPRETLRLGLIAQHSGFPVLAITHRNDLDQPPDPSGYHQFGVTERFDVEAAIDYAVAQGAQRIVLGGLSSGGAHVLAALYESDRAGMVVGVILDAGNIDFAETVDFRASLREIPLVGLPVPGSLAWTARTITAFRIGVDWSEIDYVAKSDRLPVPVLAFHGTADDGVPISISIDLAESRPDLIRLVQVEEAKHVQSWNVEPDRYEQEVTTFLQGL